MTDTTSDAVATLAQALGIIGRGPGRSRPLTRSEARDAFAALLAGTALDVQAGAFLLLMRYRGETAEELAGLVDAARIHIARTTVGTAPGGRLRPALDWPSYKGRVRLGRFAWLGGRVAGGRMGHRMAVADRGRRGR